MGKMSKYVRMAMTADEGKMRGKMKNEYRMGYGGYEDGYESVYEPHDRMESRRRRNSRGRFMRGETDDEDREMNVIGFYTGDEITAPRAMDAERRSRDEGEWQKGEMQHSEMQHSHVKSTSPFDLNKAMKWARHMKNEDGSTGAHWSFEQVRKVMKERGIHYNEAAFFAILNALYSDYCVVFKDHGIGENLDFYLDMTKAWLDDEDAVEDKAGAYYECVVKH